jgi:hypothetical protein
MKTSKILITLLIGLFFISCHKLDESFRDRIVPAVGVGADDPAALLKGAYNSLNGPLVDQARWFCVTAHTTDECLGPTRGPDWDDNGVWRVLHNHRWDADHSFANATFVDLQQAQYAATAVLDASPTPQQAAEAKFIRALVMYFTLDAWGQVPFRATTTGDVVRTLPETKAGGPAVDFLISELNAAIPNLPAGPKWKANKDAARVLLMKLYLNKGVFVNRAAPTFAAADMNQVIALADGIIAGGSYSLNANYFGNFAPDNSTSVNENIFQIQHDPASGIGGNNQSRWYLGLHYNQNPSGWNGFTTLSDFYNKFEVSDIRRGMAYPGITNVGGVRVGFLRGQQYDQNGVALKDRRNNPLAFTDDVHLKETGSNLEITGIRVMKYPIDYQFNFPARNHLVYFRYSDVLLMKAEAILRGGTATGSAPYNSPLNLVNFVRGVRGASVLSSVDLNVMLDERGREFYWEGQRRNDLIRFGKFLAAFQEKPVSGPERLLFPIPNPQLAANPNLTQNPGY